MNFIYFFILCTKIICSTNEVDYVLKKEEDNARHFKITETEDKIILSLNSKNYFPIFGSWYDGETLISFKQFYINDEDVSTLLSKKFTDQNFLKHFLNNLNDHVFEFKTDKVLLRENSNNFDAKFVLIRKDFLEKIMIEYSNDIAAINVSNEDALVQAFDKALVKIVNSGFNYNIEFGKELEQMLSSNAKVSLVHITDE